MPYQVIGRLGRGGMGVVDLAVDEHGDRVAVKRLALAGSAGDLERARVRIRREAEVLARIDHPGVVRLLAVDDDGGDVVLVMPYLPGGTLADRVRDDGPLPADDVDALADALLGALAAAHRAGVTHRDIKPANVLFDAGGRPHLADFGVASSRDATPGLTALDSVIGTPGFMAPEQARGDDAGPPADVFALGATLLYAATGHGPYGDGDPMVLLQRAARGRVARPPRSLPAPLRRLLASLLDPSPGRRPTAAAASGGRGDTVVRTIVGRALDRNRRRVALAAAVAVVATAAIVALSVGVSGRPEAAAGPTTTAPPPCTDLPYRPCGQPVAPFTDGTRCTLDHADFDGNRANGCEAAPDTVDGTRLTGSVRANLVPVGDVDRYPVPVADHRQLLCDGRVRLTITAPAGAAVHLEVRDAKGRPLAETASADGVPASVSLDEPSCFGNDATTLTAIVTSVGPERTAATYRLDHTGSY